MDGDDDPPTPRSKGHRGGKWDYLTLAMWKQEKGFNRTNPF